MPPPTRRHADKRTPKERAEFERVARAEDLSFAQYNVLRILVPLTIEDDTLERGLEILEQTMAEVSA